MRPLTVQMQLSHPRTNKPDDRTDEDGNYVEIRIEDQASSQMLARITMTPEQLGALVAGRMVTVTADTATRPERLGKVMVTDSRVIGWVAREDEDQVIEEHAVAARAEGWETVEGQRSNQGLRIVRRRWDEPATD